MTKTFTMMTTIGAVSAMLVFNANALPFAPAKQMGAENNLTLVRDGCGRGMRYSNGRDRCVSQSNRGWRDSGRRHNRHRNGDAGEAFGRAIGSMLFGHQSRGHRRDHHRRDR